MLRRGLLISTVCMACQFSHGTLPVDSGMDGDGQPDSQMLGACDALDVEAQAEHTCARAADGSVYCWGRSEHGQLGVLPLDNRCTSTTATGYCSPAPRKLSLADVRDLAVGQHHACAVTGTNTYCWGLNAFGQYGNGMTTDLVPHGVIAEREGATAIAAGIFHTCSLKGSYVSCSGKNDHGEVGDNTTAQQLSAVEVFQTAISLAAGSYSSCAIDAQADLWCWGRNDYKQIDNSQQVRRIPTKVAGIIAGEVAVGINHLCVVTTNDRAQCWGSNSNGQLGDGNTSAMPTPPVFMNVANVREISAGPYHTCARDGEGAVWCFGLNYAPTPMKVPLPRPALAITSGSQHDCAVTDDHKIYCWGDQSYGQLGNDVASTTRQPIPQQAMLCR